MKRLLALGCLGVATACGLGGGAESPVRCDNAPEPTASTVELELDFDDLVGDGAVVPSVTNAGHRAVRTEVVTSAGGRIVLAPGAGSGHALRFPRFHASGESPAAVLVVRTDDAVDTFSPGKRDFRFGADFSLDATSAGTGSDNGDNLIQRGLFGNEAQYKIQLDRGRPSCRIAGAGGEAMVRSTSKVVRGRWYTVTCERVGDEVALTVQALEARRAPMTSRVSARTGAVLMADATVPLSVGGKVYPDGAIAKSATDQFNGTVDNVVFDVAQ